MSDAARPRVIVCTPTFNRRRCIPLLVDCLRAQTYPAELVRWFVLDDGTDPVADLLEDLEFCTYVRHDARLSIGHKRKLLAAMCANADGEAPDTVVVHMDDDDYYPPTRIACAVRALRANPDVLIAGCRRMYMYSIPRQKMYACGPYGENHCTAATMAYRVGLLTQRRHDFQEKDVLNEERAFLKNYTTPIVDLPPEETILVFSHAHNSCSKDGIMDRPEAQTNVRPEQFVADPAVFARYVSDMSATALAGYAAGDAAHKPEIQARVAEITEGRRRATDAHTRQQLIDKIASGEIPVDLLNNFIAQHSAGYLDTVLEEKNRLISKLTAKVREQRGKISALESGARA
jgi:hypothetical protein